MIKLLSRNGRNYTVISRIPQLIWAYGHARRAGILTLASALVTLSLSVFLISQLKAQNRVAGEGRVARAASVTGASYLYSCVFDGPAKVDDYALVSARVAGECHDSGIKASEPKPEQWKKGNFYLGVIKEIKELGDVTIGSIAMAIESAGNSGGWIIGETISSGTISADAKPRPKPKVAAPEQAAQQLTQLRELAHKKGLRWSIHCRENVLEPDRDFLAWAEPRSMPRSAYYIEDGAVPEWILIAPTQEAAVRLLYKAIQGPPTYQPSHRPASANKHKPCPAPLEGE